MRFQGSGFRFQGSGFGVHVCGRVAAGLILLASPGLAAPANPLEPADTSSPRATLDSYLKACMEMYQVAKGTPSRESVRAWREAEGRALRCLDLSEEPEYDRESAGREAALALKEVLDRVGYPPLKDVPGPGSEGDLPRAWRIPGTEVTIARVADDRGVEEYLFTPETVDHALAYYGRVKDLPYLAEVETVTEGLLSWCLHEPRDPFLAAIVRRLPDWFMTPIGQQALWQWIAFALTILVSFLAMYLAYRYGHLLTKRLEGRVGWLRNLFPLLLPLVAMAVPVMVKDYIVDSIGIGGNMAGLVKFTANLVFLVAAMIVILTTADRLSVIVITSPRVKLGRMDKHLVRLGGRVLGIAAAIVVFLEGGKFLGIPITTLLAGAGVGGVAVALAAQDTLKNLFGSMMIGLDKPFHIGERVVIKGYDGIVEDIGLRSTRLRLLSGHQASIPNDTMATSDVENIGRRPHIRRLINIALPLDTSRAQAQKAVEIVRELLQDHEGMKPGLEPKAYLNDITRDALTILAICWYHPPAYWDYLAFCERFNLTLMERFEAEGIRIALPTSKTVFEREGTEGMNDE